MPNDDYPWTPKFLCEAFDLAEKGLGLFPAFKDLVGPLRVGLERLFESAHEARSLRGCLVSLTHQMNEQKREIERLKSFLEDRK